MLSVCKNIRSLYFDCTFYRYMSPADLALVFYTDAHYFLEAVGSAKGDTDAAIDVVRLAEWNFNKTAVVPAPADPSADKYKPASEVEAEFEEELSKLLDARGVGRRRRRYYY
jgi:hypothetical protein